jgi:hypothetical protein
MQKIFDIIATSLVLIASAFCLFLVAAKFGDGNVFVMLWMIVGPILFFCAFGLLVLHTMIRAIMAQSVSIRPMPFLAIGMSMLWYVILDLLGGGSIIYTTLAAIIGLGVAVLIFQIRVLFVRELAALCFAWIAWFYGEQNQIMSLVTGCIFAMSVMAWRDNKRGRRGHP